jgi:ferredoxin
VCGNLLAAGAVAETEGRWYLARNKQRVGPLSLVQLRTMLALDSLSPTDMLLPVGARKWVPASEVQELFPVLALPSAACAGPVAEKPVSRHQALAEAQVVPDPARCIQCGCCTYNCPMGIDVRAYAWRGLPVHDSHCFTCGECVQRCPRGVLAFQPISLVNSKWSSDAAPSPDHWLGNRRPRGGGSDP